MNKVIAHTLGIMLSLVLMFSILPAALGTCTDTINVYGGQNIKLTATPSSPAGSYDYLWVTQGGITLPQDVTTSSIDILAPTQGGLYQVTVYVSNHDAPPNTCIDSKTICINSIGTTYCPLCQGDFCITEKGTAPDCPPFFDYKGLENDNYIYNYATLPHTDPSGSYPGFMLQSSAIPDYTLDWNKLDLAEPTETKACTTIKFWITDKNTGDQIGSPCEKQICLYWDPTAGIIPVY
jgi:hypothetical protein